MVLLSLSHATSPPAILLVFPMLVATSGTGQQALASNAPPTGGSTMVDALNQTPTARVSTPRMDSVSVVIEDTTLLSTRTIMVQLWLFPANILQVTLLPQPTRAARDGTPLPASNALKIGPSLLRVSASKCLIVARLMMDSHALVATTDLS